MFKPVFLLLFLTFTAISCGPRAIPKQPVAAEDLIASYRLMAEGDQLLEEGKEHLALVKFLEASTFNPYSEIIFNKIAVTCSRLQMYPQAKKAVERAIGLNKNYAFAYNTQGILYLAEMRSGRAVRSFRRALALNPDSAHFYVNLGYAYIQQNRFEEGLEAYRRALERDPEVFAKTEGIQLSYPAKESSLAERNYQMARVFAQLGLKQSSLHYLEKAFSGGFTDLKRLREEPAFREIVRDADFERLLGAYGLILSSVR